MFCFACKRIPLSVLLLTALFSGFSAGPVIELTEADAACGKIEAVTLGRHRSNDLAASKPIYDSSTQRCDKFLFGPLRTPVHPCSKNSARNGIGAPLML